jgi:hypothetical protein
MCDWNRFGLTRGAAAAGLGEQRADELVDLVGLAVVGVDRDVDRVVRGDAVDVLREGDRADGHVLDELAGSELAPPVLTCRMPSLLASAKAASAALIVLEEVMLIAGYANFSVRAWSSILQYVA